MEGKDCYATCKEIFAGCRDTDFKNAYDWYDFTTKVVPNADPDDGFSAKFLQMCKDKNKIVKSKLTFPVYVMDKQTCVLGDKKYKSRNYGKCNQYRARTRNRPGLTRICPCY